MEAFTSHQGIVMPLDRVNVDTDAIIPAMYLKAVTRTGFADGLFKHWRYLGETTQPNPQFVLNMPRYKNATILLTRDNFGCGSSREHAPWALQEYGFRAIIAPSFADIFYNNCFNTGILLIKLDASIIQSLFEAVEANEGYHLAIDLEAQSITTPEQQILHFELERPKKEALLQGLDSVGRILRYTNEIAAFEQRRKQALPWLFA
ncbi:3-isopropylmalate dehydratase small subunit [Ktedonosporobacter rubrisoli]|uniref:3-isopropylmalate dehydratase small subunit n=1 Tax=Ktedonosporobacter rubrisoli TaxID=2509675 RepID=A0A4P6K474_KTERU|nr:3-isopropylmalate dehydratase small subunit [Ktedonosporobacter rubrisoli]QBD83097.1 3-isopropylmalate dehydratase small subunit [Ktedonosporobacter rubrisoli]